VREPGHYFDLNADDRGPALDETDLRRLEETLGVRLPEALVALLRVRNGGWLRYDTFPLPERAWDGTTYASFYELMGVDPDGRGLFQIPYLRGEWSLPDWAVMFCGDGHTWLALDYRKPDAPTVVWLESADEDEAPPAVTALAPSFEAFLDGLRMSDESTCWGFTEPTGIVLDRISTRHGVRLSSQFDAVVQPAQGRTSGRVQLSSNRGRREELVWPEFPTMRALLTFGIEAEQRKDAEQWVSGLGLEATLIYAGDAVVHDG
jgi:hypothetical protein